jgi:hypothetical protein
MTSVRVNSESQLDTLWRPAPVLFAAVSAGCATFLAACLAFGAELPFSSRLPLAMTMVVTIASVIGTALDASKRPPRVRIEIATLCALVSAAVVMGLVTMYQVVAYIRLPADLVTFAEGTFIGDIIKLRSGVPLYTSPQDNNTLPYTPGAQIITYVIASIVGRVESIPFLRAIQFSYVLLAVVVATSACDLVARRFLSSDEYRYRALWLTAWAPLCFLVSVDLRFNHNTQSLHNDGLALLVGVTAFWLIVRHALYPRAWLLVGMAVLPALGFMAKQNQLLWSAVFLFYLIGGGGVPVRHVLATALGMVAAVGIVLGVSIALWGEPFIHFTFHALGQKQVSIARVIQAVLAAGVYAGMGLMGGWVLAIQEGSRRSVAMWLSWLLVFTVCAYTTGVGFQRNHLGPALMIAQCWFLPALVKLWPTVRAGETSWRPNAVGVLMVAAMVLVFGGMGLVRDLKNPIPEDFARYVAEIDAEFEGAPPERILMDFGSWPYLKGNVLMKDRGASVALSVGANQPTISHAALRATIDRVERQVYDKILVRQLDTDLSAYDFGNRGSGVKTAMLKHYRVARRIPGVRGIEQWWPMQMIVEVLVLVPIPPQSEPRRIQ